MIKLFSALLLVPILHSFSVYAGDHTNTANNDYLKLCNTSHINIIFVLDVGNAELYLPDCNILDYSEFMLAITYSRPFTAEDFIVSSNKLIERNNPLDVYNKIKNNLYAFNGNYQAVVKGDEYRISYTNKNGFTLQKNGQLISSSPDKDLAMAYFNVWFGERPFHQKMKKNLLKNIKIISSDQIKK